MFTEIDVAELVEHPKNEFFFDDIDGEKWEEFLCSIQKSGVITPIVISPDRVIISGHQRVRACKALGIKKIKCYTIDLPDEDSYTLALIDSNIRQRGVVSGPNVKLGRIVKELERICGSNGGAAEGKICANGAGGRVRKNVRNYLNITRDDADRSRTLASMPGDVESLISNGVVSTRTLLDVVAKLSSDDQVELFKSLDSTRKYTQQEIKAAIEKILPDAQRIDEMQQKLAEYQSNIGETEVQLREKISTLTQKERTTYETLMAERRIHKKSVEDYERRLENVEELLEQSSSDQEIAEYQSKIDQLQEERDQAESYATVAQNDADLLVICATAESMTSAISEAACGSAIFTGDLVDRALRALQHLDEKLCDIRKRFGDTHAEGAA